MQSWAEQQLAILRPQYQDWDLWVVAKAPAKGYWWCARPTGHPVATINADSPEELIEEIRNQEQTRHAPGIMGSRAVFD